VTALFLGGLEALARILEPARPRPTAVEGELWTPEGGDHFYTLKPRARGWPPAEVNADGLRDRAHPVEKPEDTARVVVLGDSVAEGFGVGADETFPRVLETRLDAQGERLEILSVAVKGWSTRQQRIAYHRIARRYQPDLVLVAAVLNDIVELEHQLRRPPRLVAWLHGRSALVRRLVRARERERRQVEELFRPEATFDVFFEELRTLAGEARGDGVDFAVVLLPYRFQLADDAPTPRVQQALDAFCAHESLRCLDLLPSFRGLGERAFVDENHLSAEGCRLVADEILGSGLLPRRSFVPELVAELRAQGERGESVSHWVETGRPRPAPRGTLPALLDSLGSREASVRAASAWALEALGPEAGPARKRLTRLLCDKHESVRAAAARALGRLGTSADAAVPSLFTALQDPRAAVRWEAARALARIGVAARDVPELAGALESPDEYVRNFAAWTLGQMGERAGGAAEALIEMLGEEERYDLKGAADAVRRLGPTIRSAVPGVVARLESLDSHRRANAALTLAKIGPEAAEAVPALVAALQDPDTPVRANTAYALGHIGTRTPEVVAALLGALDDRKAWVRTEAARALGKLAPEDELVIDRLLDALTDPDERVRIHAARALGRLGRRQARVLAALEDASRDPGDRVRSEARRALETLRR
jgi:HEAT repeat protein/lysophospholipase L1-like esterase